MTTAALAQTPRPHLGLQTFADGGDGSRLRAAAVKAVLRLVDAWDDSNAEGAALLGVSESTWNRRKRAAGTGH